MKRTRWSTHKFLDWLTEQSQVRGRALEFSVAFAVTEAVRAAIKTIRASVWTPASSADGSVRGGGDVAEVTDLLDLSTWPVGMRVILRRERPHPGRPAVTIRGTRRLALPRVRNQHHYRATQLP